MVDVPSTPERITPAAETLMSLVTSRSLVRRAVALVYFGCRLVRLSEGR